MNYETLNRGVLAAIALLAVVFYVAVVWVGWAEIKAHARKQGTISKRGGNRNARWRKTKRSS